MSHICSCVCCKLYSRSENQFTECVKWIPFRLILYLSWRFQHFTAFTSSVWEAGCESILLKKDLQAYYKNNAILHWLWATLHYPSCLLSALDCCMIRSDCIFEQTIQLNESTDSNESSHWKASRISSLRLRSISTLPFFHTQLLIMALIRLQVVLLNVQLSCWHTQV